MGFLDKPCLLGGTTQRGIASWAFWTSPVCWVVRHSVEEALERNLEVAGSETDSGDTLQLHRHPDPPPPPTPSARPVAASAYFGDDVQVMARGPRSSVQQVHAI